jgi:transposase
MMEMASKKPPPRPGETGAEIRAQATRPPPRERKPQREFTPAYKHRILRELDEARASGERGAVAALMRREGLVRSLVWQWERARDRIEQAALTKGRRGRRRTKNPLAATVAQQQREIERLKNELYKAEVVIDVQKKLSALLGIAMPVTPTDGEEKP